MPLDTTQIPSTPFLFAEMPSVSLFSGLMFSPKGTEGAVVQKQAMTSTQAPCCGTFAKLGCDNGEGFGGDMRWDAAARNTSPSGDGNDDLQEQHLEPKAPWLHRSPRNTGTTETRACKHNIGNTYRYPVQWLAHFTPTETYPSRRCRRLYAYVHVNLFL